MSLWRRLRERFFGDKESAGTDEVTDEQSVRPVEPAPDPAPKENDADPRGDSAEMQRLGAIGRADGPTEFEALTLLRRVRGTVDEARAVSIVLDAISSRAVPEPVRLATADILASRGDESGALEALHGASSEAALMLTADLYASQGMLPRALSTIERVLAWNFDAPGARERHARWRAAVGAAPTAKGRLDEATVVRDRAPDQGPLPAIVDGLASLPSQVTAALAIACDSPLLEPALVETLFQSLTTDCDAVVPIDGELLHPLLAVYRSRVADMLRKELDAGTHSLQRAIRAASFTPLFLPVEQLRSVDPELRSFLSCNTWDEYKAALELTTRPNGPRRDSPGRSPGSRDA